MSFKTEARFSGCRTVTKWKKVSIAVCALGVLTGVFVLPQQVAAMETQTPAVTALPLPDTKGGSAVDTRIEQNQPVKVKSVWETLQWAGRRLDELKLEGAVVRDSHVVAERAHHDRRFEIGLALRCLAERRGISRM